MPSRIRVSGIITNYNHGDFLSDAVQRLAKQTRRPDEIILVDDASTDCSHEVIAKLERDFPQLIVIRHEKNQGVNAAVESGIARSTGDYFANLGADDPLQPFFLERALGICAAHPNLGLCTGEHQLIYANGGNPMPIVVGLATKPSYFSSAQFADIYRQRTELSIPTAPAIWRRQAWAESGRFQGKLQWLSDWFAALVVANRHGYGYVPGIMQSIRYNPQSYSCAGMAERTAFRQLMLTLLETIDQPEYRDVQPFFSISSVLARFGFKLLNVIIENPRYHRYLSPALIQAAASHDRVTVNMPAGIFGSMSPDKRIAIVKGVIAQAARVLAAQAETARQNGQLPRAVACANAALDADPDHQPARAIIEQIQSASAAIALSA